jgi:hypothetical protein
LDIKQKKAIALKWPELAEANKIEENDLEICKLLADLIGASVKFQ